MRKGKKERKREDERKKRRWIGKRGGGVMRIENKVMRERGRWNEGGGR